MRFKKMAAKISKKSTKMHEQDISGIFINFVFENIFKQDLKKIHLIKRIHDCVVKQVYRGKIINILKIDLFNISQKRIYLSY